jgi:hypothetical protein
MAGAIAFSLPLITLRCFASSTLQQAKAKNAAGYLVKSLGLPTQHENVFVREADTSHNKSPTSIIDQGGQQQGQPQPHQHTIAGQIRFSQLRKYLNADRNTLQPLHADRSSHDRFNQPCSSLSLEGRWDIWDCLFTFATSKACMPCTCQIEGSHLACILCDDDTCDLHPVFLMPAAIPLIVMRRTSRRR